LFKNRNPTRDLDGKFVKCRVLKCKKMSIFVEIKMLEFRYITGLFAEKMIKYVKILKFVKEMEIK